MNEEFVGKVFSGKRLSMGGAKELPKELLYMQHDTFKSGRNKYKPSIWIEGEFYPVVGTSVYLKVDISDSSNPQVDILGHQ